MYNPKGFNGKLSKYFFFKYEHIFFLEILIEIFIMKTTMYHKYTLIYQKYKKKTLLKNATIVYVLHFALNIGGISAQSHNPYVTICHLFFQVT
jgi:hypothetical protein